MNTEQAVSHFGSKKKLADALLLSPSAITQWGSVIPMLRQFQIQMLTEGALIADAVDSPTMTQSSPYPINLTLGSDGAVIPSSVHDTCTY